MNDGKAATMLTDAQEGRASGRTSGRGVLEARELRKVYGSGSAQLTILAGVNLQLAEGEMVAIVAPSGAGKSTLLHLLAALDTPTSGTVYFDAKPVDGRADAALAEFRNRAVGFVWQRHHLLPDFADCHAQCGAGRAVRSSGGPGARRPETSERGAYERRDGP